VADRETTIPEATPGSSRPSTKVLAGAVLAAATLGGGWYLQSRTSGHAAAVAERSGTVLHLEPFVLNLADPDQRSYLRVGVDVQIAGTVREDARAASTARVRDTILTVLTQRGADELLSADGKSRLKKDLARSLQSRIPELQVEEVYFTEFLIQR